MIEYAIEEELITANPAAGVLKKLGLDGRNDREPVRPMTPDEVELFLEKCLKYEMKWHPFFKQWRKPGLCQRATRAFKHSGDRGHLRTPDSKQQSRGCQPPL
jgi:hypothetical protein